MPGKRSVAILLAAIALAGCGGDGEPSPSEDDIAQVRDAIVGFGTTQAVRCEAAGGAELRGLAVIRCGFEEEEDVSGAMRAQDRCYVVESGAVVDVSRELPIGDLRSCMISAP
ncbi:MAG: hypothetical protein H0V94_04640 [Actinobacteria bacterium]|nr:hypothetical protein [Actinomycetota bacterium]